MFSVQYFERAHVCHRRLDSQAPMAGGAAPEVEPALYYAYTHALEIQNP